jgi:hypothetical protein
VRRASCSRTSSRAWSLLSAACRIRRTVALASPASTLGLRDSRRYWCLIMIQECRALRAVPQWAEALIRVRDYRPGIARKLRRWGRNLSSAAVMDAS